METYVADTGKPLLLTDTQRSIWPGQNMDPSSVLVLGLGLIAGNDPICK